MAKKKLMMTTPTRAENAGGGHGHVEGGGDVGDDGGRGGAGRHVAPAAVALGDGDGGGGELRHAVCSGSQQC